MNVHSRAPSVLQPSLRRSPSLGALGSIGPFFLVVSSAHAQTATPTAASPSGVMRVLDRLDPRATVLVVVAIVIVVLLVWRMASMVRRDRPVVAPSNPRRRTGGSGDDDWTVRPTQMGRSDWGFDQNKRAALARTNIELARADVDLPSLDKALTQWSMTDVQKANSAGFQTDDSLGKSPNQAPSPYRTSFNPYFKREQPTPRMDTVEVADTLLQAELLVQLGDPKQAMTLLSHHIRDTEKPGPAAWLMLLNLYQTTGRESQYNALALGFKTLFNAQVPAWASSANDAARDLETYLQAMMKVQAAWSAGDARVTVERLLNDDRGGSRQGFSISAYRELLFLTEILDGLDAMAADEEERSGIRRKLDATSRETAAATGGGRPGPH